VTLKKLARLQGERKERLVQGKQIQADTQEARPSGFVLIK
jgi:hypothetical protein